MTDATPSTLTLSFGPNLTPVEVGQIAWLASQTSLTLECGATLRHFPMAYQSWGTLNADKSNAVLVCHGLTGDQYAASPHPVTGKPGWWESVIGPGKPLDTNKLFVICPNTLGGCMGSAGPKTINPETGTPYRLDFPMITINDMVAAQHLLIEHLGIHTLLAVVGGSMGGMQALAWASLYPKKLRAVIPIACAARHTAENIAFHEIGRQAIIADPNWQGGAYEEAGTFPSKGLSIARMTAHVTYLSKEALARKFGRNLQDRQTVSYGFEADFQIESYLRHQGMRFIDRFDPNSYLYITKAMDYFDLNAAHGGDLSAAFAPSEAAFCIIAFSSDWLFPASEAKPIVHALAGQAADVSFVEITSDKGHDAFLLDEPLFYETMAGFMEKIMKRYGL